MINEAFAYMTSVIHILDPNVDEDDISFKLQSYPGDDPSERWQLTVEDANDNEIYDWRDTSPETVITSGLKALSESLAEHEEKLKALREKASIFSRVG